MIPAEYFLFLLFGVLGLVFGSFGSVLLCRLPAGQHVGGRSRCPGCKHLLGATELIPLVSYCLQIGRCRHCRRPIGARYPLLEIGAALLFLLALWIAVQPLPSLLLALSLWLLLLIAVMDARTATIHDALNSSFICLALAYSAAAGRTDLRGSLLLGVFFGGQWLFSRGRLVGSGDVLLSVGIGFLVGGVAQSLLCLGMAYVLGAIVATVLLAAKRATRKSQIAFGPFLAIATLLTVLFGDRLLGWIVPGLM